MSEELWMELDKIDELRERMGVSYEEARQALNETQGDVIQALINLENKGKSQAWKNKGQDVLSSVRSTMANLNHIRVNVRKDHKKVLSVSAPLGMALAYTIWRNRALRVLGLAGMAGALFSRKIDIEVEQPNTEAFEYVDKESEMFANPKHAADPKPAADPMSDRVNIPSDAPKPVPDV